MVDILVFGDSNTYGYGDPQGGWVARLRRDIEKRIREDDPFYGTVYNLGISGDTTADIIKRFPKEIKSRRPEKPILVVVDVGSNDAQWLLKANKLRVSPMTFVKQYTKLVKMAKQITPHVIALDSGPVDEEKVDPIPWAPNKAYRNQDIQLINQLIKSVAEREKITFISTWPLFYPVQSTDYTDGVHLTSASHDRIYARIKPIIWEWMERIEKS